MAKLEERKALDVIEAIQERRSINFFDTERDVPDRLLKELLNTANLAPSSFNLQPWKVIAVKDRERKKVLRECAMNQPKVEEAPVVLIMVADPAALEENVDFMLTSWENLGYIKTENKNLLIKMIDRLYGPKDSLTRKFFAVKNTGLFAMNLMMAAKGFGLDTHPMDGMDESCVKREFNIGEDCVVPMLIAVGYLRPGINLLPRAFRRELDKFVTFV